jgi:rare lipoprotein A
MRTPCGMFEFVVLVLLSSQPIQPVAEGIASYYTTRESSSITASGDPLRDEGFTCAMRRGKFGDYYLVVAPSGRAVVCKLNDRGPYVAGRVIDLSHAAIHELHESDGLIPVKVYLLGGHPPGQLGRRGSLHSRVNK